MQEPNLSQKKKKRKEKAKILVLSRYLIHKFYFLPSKSIFSMVVGLSNLNDCTNTLSTYSNTLLSPSSNLTL